MKRTNKILLITFVLLLVLTITVKADSFKFNVTANKTSLKPGDTVEINLNISNIDAGDLGINTLEAVLEYDSNVFEEVTQSNLTSLNNWSLTYNSEDTENKGKFLAVIVASGVKENQDIGKITLKVKNSATDTNTTVRFKNVASNNGQTLIEETDKTINFKVQSGNSTSGNQNTQNTQNTQTTKPVTNTGNSSSGIIVQKPSSSGQSTGKLPQTGIQNYMIYIAIGILIVAGIIGYIGYRKMKNRE